MTAAMFVAGTTVHASDIDARIESSAKKSYVFKTYLQNDAIKTKSTDGVVILSGTVKEESHKALAYETVANLPGVKNVDNQLKLEGDLPAENSDAWMSMQVKYSLLYNRNVSGTRTQVFVKDGIATLKGEAENQAQKDLAGEYAKDVVGIKSVINEITIAKAEPQVEQNMGEKIDDASITAQVKMALMSHRSTSVFKTGVKTIDGIVTLTGVAENGAGKDMAAKVANDVHGVTSVVNDMTVADALSKK